MSSDQNIPNLIRSVIYQRQRIMALEDALRPFAMFAAAVDGNKASAPTGSSCPLSCDYAYPGPGIITVGHCRAAAKLLEDQQ